MLLVENIVEQFVVNRPCAAHFAHHISEGHAQDDGYEQSELPRKFHDHNYCRKRCFDDCCKERCHTNHNYAIGVFGRHAPSDAEFCHERADTRAYCEHRNEYSARHACAEIERGGDNSHHEHENKRNHDGRREYGLNALLRRSAVRSQRLDKRVTAAHNGGGDKPENACEYKREQQFEIGCRKRVFCFDFSKEFL